MASLLKVTLLRLRGRPVRIIDSPCCFRNFNTSHCRPGLQQRAEARIASPASTASAFVEPSVLLALGPRLNGSRAGPAAPPTWLRAWAPLIVVLKTSILRPALPTPLFPLPVLQCLPAVRGLAVPFGPSKGPGELTNWWPDFPTRIKMLADERHKALSAGYPPGQVPVLSHEIHDDVLSLARHQKPKQRRARL